MYRERERDPERERGEGGRGGGRKREIKVDMLTTHTKTMVQQHVYKTDEIVFPKGTNTLHRVSG